MTLTCPHCAEKNVVAGFLNIQSAVQGKANVRVECWKCRRELTVEKAREEGADHASSSTT